MEVEKRKQKVKVLTFHWSNNYGALLQAFALAKVIRSLGFDCFILNYVGGMVKKEHALFHASPKLLLSDILFFHKHFKRRLASNKFKRSILLSNEISQEDILVTGSDQIWNPLITGSDGMYFGTGINCKKVISYAASMGQNIGEKYTDWFFSNLRNVQRISVREKTLKNYIKSNTAFSDTTVDIVLDPTLLLSRNEWKENISFPKNNINRPYLFVYSVDNANIQFVECVNRISDMLKLPVVCAGQSIHKNLQFKNVIKMFGSNGPDVFLSLLDGAELCFTSSFHGTAFAINFNKPFFSYLPRSNASRLKDLLEAVQLENRIISALDDVTTDALKTEIDFAKVNNILEKQRDDSVAWLKEALDLEN